jgi:hypothetical protein
MQKTKTQTKTNINFNNLYSNQNYVLWLYEELEVSKNHDKYWLSNFALNYLDLIPYILVFSLFTLMNYYFWLLVIFVSIIPIFYHFLEEYYYVRYLKYKYKVCKLFSLKPAKLHYFNLNKNNYIIKQNKL